MSINLSGQTTNMKMHMNIGIKLIAFFLIPLTSMAQFVISSGTKVAGINNVPVTVVTPNDVSNGSDVVNFSGINLRLSLVGSIQTINGNWTLNLLEVNGPLTTLQGDVTVTGGITFTKGVVRVPENFTLLYTGPGEGVTYDESQSGLSYIDGKFTQQGTGERTFPMGEGTNFLPLIFNNVQTSAPITVQAFASSPNIAPNLDVLSVYDTRYWQITSDDLAGIASQVDLYSEKLVPPSEGSIVVVEADPLELVARNLYNESSKGPSFTRSQSAITKPLLALGTSENVDIKIHDLITPFDAGITDVESGNDVIVVDNLFDDNKVVLMDRWGVTLKEWINYDPKTADISFFQSLSPGSYIVVVDCTTPQGAKKNGTQMVTVLKTK